MSHYVQKVLTVNIVTKEYKEMELFCHNICFRLVLVCENGYYGYNCSEVCQCMEENTESCHHLNGNCTCKKVYKLFLL